MDSPNDDVPGDFMTENEEEDPFLKFIDYAKSILNENAGELKEEDPTRCPSWSWIAIRILKTCVAYSSGVTPAILLSELSLAWNEQNRSGAPKKQSDFIVNVKKKHKRERLTNTITIDSIYEKKFLPLSSVIEAVIVDASVLPGTNIYMLTLGDIWSSNTIDLYLHRRFLEGIWAAHVFCQLNNLLCCWMRMKIMMPCFLEHNFVLIPFLQFHLMQ